MATWSMISFQDSNCYIMTLMTYFYDFMLIVMMMILLFIFYIMFWFFINKYMNLTILHNSLMEIIWTLIPMFILFFVAVPSLKILYMVEEMIDPFMTLKILGHQWYWSYEYSDFGDIEFDSFMLDLMMIEKGMFRLLDVDNRLILPYCMPIRGLVSSVDVIHSWAMPSMGIKVDAIPGRINQMMFYISRSGLYFGQCSEICGLNHSFMPIVLESVSLNGFINWLIKF